MTADDYDAAILFIALQDEAARPFLRQPAMLARVNTVRLVAMLSGKDVTKVAADATFRSQSALKAIDEG